MQRESGLTVQLKSENSTRGAGICERDGITIRHDSRSYPKTCLSSKSEQLK